jgi:hypothetical protein
MQNKISLLVRDFTKQRMVWTMTSPGAPEVRVSQKYSEHQSFPKYTPAVGAVGADSYSNFKDKTSIHHKSWSVAWWT